MRAYEIVDNAGDRSPMHEALPSTQSKPTLNACDDESDSGSGSEISLMGFEQAERVMKLMNDVVFAWPVDTTTRRAADRAFLCEDQASKGGDALLVPSPMRKGEEGSGYLSSVSEGEASESPMRVEIRVDSKQAGRLGRLALDGCLDV